MEININLVVIVLKLLKEKIEEDKFMEIKKCYLVFKNCERLVEIWVNLLIWNNFLEKVCLVDIKL